MGGLLDWLGHSHTWVALSHVVCMYMYVCMHIYMHNDVA